MLDVTLVDVIATKHGVDPRTYKRSKDIPIDCCFGSAVLKINKGGYLSFGRLYSDHRGIWIELALKLLLVHKPPPLTFFQTRHLKLSNPRVTNKYLDYLFQSCRANGIFYEMDKLHRRTVYPLTPSMAVRFESLDVQIETFIELVEEKCRKLKTGEVSWSPGYKHICLELLYWYMRKDYILDQHTNVRQLITLQHKLSIVYNPQLSVAEVISELQSAHKQRKRIKMMAEDLSLE